jgi:hypothetical protein
MRAFMKALPCGVPVANVGCGPEAKRCGFSWFAFFGLLKRNVKIASLNDPKNKTMMDVCSLKIEVLVAAHADLHFDRV